MKSKQGPSLYALSAPRGRTEAMYDAKEHAKSCKRLGRGARFGDDAASKQTC